MTMTPKHLTLLVLALLATGAAMVAGCAAARADELSDLRARQAQVGSRIDQLAKPADPQAGAPTLDRPPASDPSPTFDRPPAGDTTGAGSFPRSFLIPGTDTSVRIGGSVDATLGYH
jgi:hypothetical protein